MSGTSFAVIVVKLVGIEYYVCEECRTFCGLQGILCSIHAAGLLA